MGPLQFSYGLLASLSLIISLTACSENKSRRVAIPRPTNEVTAANYLNGRAFCNKYSEITSKEHGVFVQVPFNHNDPSQGTTEVYAWTNKPFNPNLKTYIYLDGGPGSNSHGSANFLKISKETFPHNNSLDSQWNQIFLDQRGVGCSAPSTFEQYKNPNFYSSRNITLDMEAVRKTYGISKWTVYGISYGTVPATVYASKSPEFTRSLVIEGVVSNPKELSSEESKADKMNQMLSQFNSAQRDNFRKLWKDDRYQSIFTSLFSYMMYKNGGYKQFKDYLNSVIEPNGQINYQVLHALEKGLDEYDQAQSSPQAPGNVDEQFFSTLYCKELNLSGTTKYTYFDEYRFKFYTASYEFDDSECKNYGVTNEMVHRYNSVDYPVSVHVAYFQGTHDGATPITGAVSHWMNVPRAGSQMLVSTRGGHNPMIERLYYNDNTDEKPTAQEKEKLLKIISLSQLAFTTALNGDRITDQIIGAINLELPRDEQWFSPEKSSVGFRMIEEASRYVNKKLAK